MEARQDSSSPGAGCQRDREVWWLLQGPFLAPHHFLPPREGWIAGGPLQLGLGSQRLQLLIHREARAGLALPPGSLGVHAPSLGPSHCSWRVGPRLRKTTPALECPCSCPPHFPVPSALKVPPKLSLLNETLLLITRILLLVGTHQLTGWQALQKKKKKKASAREPSP